MITTNADQLQAMLEPDGVDLSLALKDLLVIGDALRFESAPESYVVPRSDGWRLGECVRAFYRFRDSLGEDGAAFLQRLAASGYPHVEELRAALGDPLLPSEVRHDDDD